MSQDFKTIPIEDEAADTDHIILVKSGVSMRKLRRLPISALPGGGGEPGPQGEQGEQGPQGEPGVLGLPDGGALNAMLRKVSSADYDVAWTSAQADANQAAVTLESIGDLPAISDPPTQAEVDAIRTALIIAQSNASNAGVLANAIRDALINFGIIKGSA